MTEAREAAIETAARAIWGAFSVWGPPIRLPKPKWDKLGESNQHIAREMARAAIAAYEAAAMDEGNWRETVRDLYDHLHFSKDGFFSGSPLAKRIIQFIEDRHPAYFTESHPLPTQPERGGDE